MGLYYYYYYYEYYYITIIINNFYLLIITTLTKRNILNVLLSLPQFRSILFLSRKYLQTLSSPTKEQTCLIAQGEGEKPNQQ